MEILKKHPHWKHVLSICKTLEEKGYSAWLAGGCVRDSLRGVMPKDIDIATNAKPPEIEKLFAKTVNVGKAFGVIRVIEDGADVEVATFRKDGPYKDGRHPENIEFSGPEEDSKRRDFTINAMFLDVKTGSIHDFVGGKKDLEAKTIRAVGDPVKRFQEDKLRILRALRFQSQLGFQIDPDTYKAIKQSAPEITQVSNERIQEEMFKLFGGEQAAQAIGLFESSGLRGYLFPKIKPLKAEDFKVIPNYPLRAELGWMMLLWGADAEGQKEILESYKFSVKGRERIQQAIQLLQKLKVFLVLDKAQKLRLAAHPEMSLALEFAKIKNFVQPEAVEFIKNNPKLPEPFIKGEDLVQKGIKPGPMFGKLLDEMFDLQLEGKIASKDQAQEILKKKFKSS